MPITYHAHGRWPTVALLATLVAVLQHAPADATHHPPIAPAPELATTFTGPASCAFGGFLSGDTVGDANPAELYARLCGHAGDQAATDAQD
jgi:hypothetical protein